MNYSQVRAALYEPVINICKKIVKVTSMQRSEKELLKLTL